MRQWPVWKGLVVFACASAICVAGVACPGPGSTAAEPILFIHGYNRNASDWNQMILRFEVDGWPKSRLSAYSYDTGQSNKISAEEVRSHVESLLKATGAGKVDIIAHSMGSLNTRWYIKFLGGESKVDDWVSLGGPNHGSTFGDFLCPSSNASCVEMRSGSTFLTALNAEDETPGGVNYGTWWSPRDGVVFPASSTPLSGATNTETPPDINHLELVQEASIYRQVREFVK